MQQWPVQDAKARFSEFLDTCLAQGPQMVTKRGAEAAVLVPWTNGAGCKRLPARRSSSCCCPTRRAPAVTLPARECPQTPPFRPTR
jgi:prevent-host-death family protein